MGDEYLWLATLGHDESVADSVSRSDRRGEDEEKKLVGRLRNEEITMDMYSVLLGVNERVEDERVTEDILDTRLEDSDDQSSERKRTNSATENDGKVSHFDEIESIQPYDEMRQGQMITRMGSTETSDDDDERQVGPYAVMNLRSIKQQEPQPSLTDNVIQIGDRAYGITSALFTTLKIYLGQTVRQAEVFTRESYGTVAVHGKSAGRAVHRHLVGGAAIIQELASVRMIAAMIRETCHFTIDRTHSFTRWYTTSLFSDDPEMVYRKSIRNTSSLSHPDCATKSLRLNSTIVKRRAQFSTISWMDRQLLWVTRDEDTGNPSAILNNTNKSNPPINDAGVVDSVDYVDSYTREDLSIDVEPKGVPSFLHCQSIFQTPTEAAFVSNNAYNPSAKNSGDESVALRPTAAATANYFDLLDALIAAAFTDKKSPQSAEAYAILVDMITPPQFEEKSSCAYCFESFSLTNFRHHCRNCGRSICRTCSSQKYKRIPKYGYTDHVRVCYRCAVKVDAEATMDRVQWRLLRIKDYLNNRLIPFFTHGVDRGIDKANRVVDMGLLVLKSALMCNYPAMMIVETVDILKRYGMAGLAGVLMRNDFVEAAETLKKISGMDKHYPISLSELTACIYYRLAIERGIRGSDPDGEHKLHYPDNLCPDDEPYCTEVPLDDMESIVDYASMALMQVYEESPIECQRIAATQGYSCICVETVSKTERPAFGIFVSNSNDAQDIPSTRRNDEFAHSPKIDVDFPMPQRRPKEVVLTVRGTLSIHDVVTDIRASPHPFPPTQEEILSLIYQGNDLDLEAAADGVPWRPSGKSGNENSPPQQSRKEEKGGDKGDDGGHNKSEHSPGKSADEWEWLLTSETKTYACSGIFRSACWLLSEVGKPLLELMNHGYRLIICGHSLGGAVASLVAYMLHEVGISNMHCYSYAAPSFVDEITASKMSPFLTQVILHDDIIPRVTPQSIRLLMKDVLFFQEQVFKYLEQDWKDAMERAAAVWVPRTRDADVVHTRFSQNQSMENLKDSKESISVNKDGDIIDDELGSDNISQYLLVLEEEVIPLWCPGKLVHIYSRNGIYYAAYVPRTFPSLRRIVVQGNIFRDHSGQSIFEALQEVRAARKAMCSPPSWTPYNDPSTNGVCKCCKSRFTWHSTFRGEAQEYRERYNCRSCGGLVCGPCSTRRQPVLRLGLISPSRICDTCFFNGHYSADRNPE